jgi:serine protease Do
VGKNVKVELVRKGRKTSLQVKVGELKEEGESQAVSKAEPNLGLTVKEITPELARNLGLSETSGLVVVQVENNTAAAKAGLRPGDMIIEIDQVPIKDLEEYHSKIQDYKKGDTVLFLVKRRGGTIYLTLRVLG